ncbi:MAG: choice-of-anchor Q domain-containing protein, partial [Fuerstiella sp.]
MLSAVSVNNAFDVVNAPDTSSIAALLNDPGADGISLREAILAANSDPGADVIDFASDPGEAFSGGGTIVLTNGQLNITSELSIDGDIDGDNVADITISGNNSSRIFDIADSSPHTNLNGLTLTQGNHSTEGGAVRVRRSSAKISNSVIDGNSAGRFGGGILAFRSTVEIVSTTISNNEAGRDGGGLEIAFGATTIASSTIVGNTAGDSGGGLINEFNNTLRVSNSTIANNTATLGHGGGIVSSGSSFELINSTVTGNSAATFGGGLVAWSNDTLQNTIVVGNSAATYAEVAGPLEVSTASLTTSIVADVFDQVDADTGGGLLSDNGGTVLTAMLKASTSNPALDLGSMPSGITVDAIGNARELDIVSIGNGGTVDAGAIELIADSNPLVVDTTNHTIDTFDGVTSLREAIAYANDTLAGPNGDGDADGDGSSNDTITFAAGVGETFENGGAITIGSRLVLSSDITIDGDVDGDGERDIDVRSGGRNIGLIHVTGGHAQLNGFTLSNGSSTSYS